MTGKELYPNVHHFKLSKELPGCKVGDVVSICNVNDAGKECLSINGIEMAIDYAQKNPDWFSPATFEEHLNDCKENTIKFLMKEKNKTRAQAEVIYNQFITYKGEEK